MLDQLDEVDLVNTVASVVLVWFGNLEDRPDGCSEGDAKLIGRQVLDNLKSETGRRRA